jgi:hypothetical protein
MMRWILFTIIYFITNKGAAQQIDSVYINNVIWKQNHISINVKPQLVTKAQTKKSGGPYSLQAENLSGISVGFYYHINIDKFNSLVTGIQGNAAQRNFTAFIPGKDFAPPEEKDFTEDGSLTRTVDFYLLFPFYYERRILYSEKNQIYFTCGTGIGFYPDEFGETFTVYKASNGTTYPIIETSLEVGNQFKPWLHFLAGIGHNWRLRNNNLIGVSLAYSYSGVELAKGTYEINVPGQPRSTGAYSSSLSNLSIGIHYLFTGTNNKLRKMYLKGKT